MDKKCVQVKVSKTAEGFRIDVAGDQLKEAMSCCAEVINCCDTKSSDCCDEKSSKSNSLQSNSD